MRTVSALCFAVSLLLASCAASPDVASILEKNAGTFMGRGSHPELRQLVNEGILPRGDAIGRRGKLTDFEYIWSDPVFICDFGQTAGRCRFIVIQHEESPFPTHTRVLLTAFGNDGRRQYSFKGMLGNRLDVLDVSILKTGMPLDFRIYAGVKGFGGALWIDYRFDGTSLKCLQCVDDKSSKYAG